MSLTPKHRSHLKSLGHHLEPIVTVGKDGPTQGVVSALSQALLDHELVKVRLGKNSQDDRQELASQLANSCEAQLCQVVGKIALVYKPHPKKPKIKLPR